jgi:NADH-quinone oxidoreductase subunit F
MSAQVRAEATPAPATRLAGPADLAFLEEVVAREGCGTEALIPVLHAIQDHYRYLPVEALRRLCVLTRIPAARIAETASFYSRFRLTPVGRHMVRVCHGTACHVAGARRIMDELRRELRIPEGANTDSQHLCTVEEVACLGCCSLAPVITVDESTVGKLDSAAAGKAVAGIQRERRA